MCLIVKKGTKIKIAENDIIVYKGFDISLNKDKVISPYMGNYYKFEKEYETTIEKTSDFCFADRIASSKYFDCKSQLESYGSGFHSCKSKKRANIHGTLFKCTIPKGSEYIKDLSGLYISNKIIIHNNL